MSSPSTNPVVTDMGRRAPIATLGRGGQLLVRAPFVPRAHWGSVMWRAVRWSLAFFVYALKRAKDTLGGDRSVEKRGQRLREVFEWMGGTAIKIGQQLAVRVDFLPFEICRELGKLMDRVPPFPFAEAVSRIEAAAGKPVAELFREIESEPIGSASIACVFRATRKSGERVALKVRRPNVGDVFAADMMLFETLTRALEWLTVVRSDFFKYLRSEIREMLFDELDFVKEANYQSMFRRYVKRDRLRWVTAPRVHADLSNHEVLATDYIDGYSCVDVLAALESRDEEALAFLKSMDVNPRRVGHRIMQLGLWSRLECPFFHSDPHPGNILVLPGDRLVMLDFGSCGITSPKNVEHQIEMSRRLMIDDIAGGTAVSLSLLAPLPAVDVEALRRRLEQRSWDYHIMLKSKDAEWWERTSAAIWISMIECTKDFNLPVNLDVLRMARASLLYDTLACRLNPSIDQKNSFQKWIRASARRARRRAEKRANRAARAGYALLIQELGSLAEIFEKGTFWASHMSRELPKEFIAAQSKGAFFAATMLRAATNASLLFVVAVLALLVWAWLDGQGPSYRQIARAVAGHPAVQIFVALVLIRAARQIQLRLTDKDPS